MPSASRKLPVAERAIAATRRGRDLDRLRLGGAPQHARDLLDARAVEVEAVAAVDDRRRHLARLGRGEHEDGVRRRLLERLQERVPGRRREHVGLVEDVDLAAPADRRVGDALAQLADVVDRVVRGGVHLDHVQRARPRDRHARVALAARLDRRPALAVQAGGEDLGHRGLAGAARADEQVGVVDLAPLRRRCAASARPAPGRRPRRTYGAGACGKASAAAPVAARKPTPSPESTHARGAAGTDSRAARADTVPARESLDQTPSGARAGPLSRSPRGRFCCAW